MAYEIFTPKGSGRGVPRGNLSLSARGMARFNAADLAAVGIVDRATILLDRERCSLALRGPLEGECGQTVGAEKKGPARSVWLSGALRVVGLEPADLHGWWLCRVAEDRLEIDLYPRKKGRRA